MEATKSFNFSDLNPNVNAWLGMSPDDKRIYVTFDEPANGNEIGFHVINGAWNGRLNCHDEEGALQIVDERGKVHDAIYIVDVMPVVPDDENDDGVPY